MDCDLGAAGDGRAEALAEEGVGEVNLPFARDIHFAVRWQQHGIARGEGEEFPLWYSGR